MKFLELLKNNKLNFLLVYLIFFILLFTLWIKREFGGHIHYVEIIFNFYINYEGLKNSPSSLKNNFFLYVINLSLFFTILSIFIFEKFKIKKILIKLIQNKSLKNLINLFFLNTKTFLLYSVIFFLIQFKFHYFLIPYIQIFENEIDKDLYIDPKTIIYQKPKKLKNLILFYVESMEYDVQKLENHINENPLEKINQIKGENIYNFKETPSIQISIAGLVASQCAVPFHPSVSINLNNHKIKNLYCLSDVLNNFNYKQYYFMTVNKSFQRTDFFKENHHIKIVDDNEIRKKYPNEKLGWGNGVHDEVMLKYAKEKILKLHEEKKPFNVIIKTTDTHPPYQKISSKCKIKNEMNIRKRAALSFKCISIEINNFLNELSYSGALDNTVVVIMGDHLLHPIYNDKKIIDAPRKNRNIYYKMSTNNNFERSKMNHFDVTPTILDELGFLNTFDKRFAFGVSLFNSNKLFNYNNHYNSVMSKKILNDYYLNQTLN